MSIIAVSTNKGGVLKTSITTNLAGALCNKNKVLIIDTDNQGNVLVSFGINPDTIEQTLFDVLVDGLDPREVIMNVHPNIDVLPSNDDMSFLEFDVLSDRHKYPSPFSMLKRALEKINKEYDYILIDSPPNLGLVQGNVLSYAESVLIPFQPEGYSMRSLIKILNAIQSFKEKHNTALEIEGVVATLVDQRTTLHSEVLQQCRKFCFENEIHMFETVIPRSVRFASSVAYERKPATLTDKKNPLVKSYFELLKEVQSIGKKTRNLASFDELASNNINKNINEDTHINVNANKETNTDKNINNHVENQGDYLDTLIEGNSKKKENETILTGIYLKKDLAQILDRLAKKGGRGAKSRIVNEALRTIFTDKGLL